MQKGLSLEMASAKVVSREHVELSCTIELWARDFNKNPVYWLNGLAGTGKSTVRGVPELTSDYVPEE